jgi:two-component system, chemotaxis family, sensor kinase Cph1
MDTGDALLPPGTPIDLTNCDREPIHIPGQIQPHGAVLALRRVDFVVVQASANAAALLGLGDQDLSGQPLDQILPPRAAEKLREALARDHLLANPQIVWTLSIGGRSFDGLAHTLNGTLIVEFEPTPQAPPLALRHPYLAVNRAMAALQQATSLDACCQAIAAHTRALTGFDRVMVYQFQPDDHGIVVAEDRQADLGSFLGLHYPASDIPRQARALYLRNWLRLIPDVAYTPVPIVPPFHPESGEPLDLSFSSLRSVSPIHIEYLMNMGVSASMSISLIIDGALWGLIACHHYSGAHHVPYELRAVCEALGRVASTQIAALEREAEGKAALRRASIQARVVAHLASADDLHEGLGGTLDFLHAFVLASGVALWLGEHWHTRGVTPAEPALRALRGWLAAHHEAIFVSQRLAQDYPPARAFIAQASGVLALALAPEWHIGILWFRPELIQTVTWGGDPSKSVLVGEDGVRLSPRKSFAQWQEQVRESSLPWTLGERADAEALRAAIATVMLHVIRHAQAFAELWREKEESDRLASELVERARVEAALRAALAEKEVLLKEVHHRVKNNLQVVISLLRIQGRSISDPHARTILRESQLRVEVMALVHELLYRAGDLGRIEASVYVRELAQYLLRMYGVGRPQIELVAKLEPLTLTIDQAIPCGLIVNELLSNSLKYAFPEGRNGVVGVALRRQGPESLCLEVWDTGAGNLATSNAGLNSLGQQLVQDLVYQLRGTLTSDQSAGFRTTIVIPYSQD